MKESNQGNHAQ
jgi:hypothetical protein